MDSDIWTVIWKPVCQLVFPFENASVCFFEVLPVDLIDLISVDLVLT